MYTKHAFGPDGNTAWEALKGKEYRAALAQFGEVVHYYRPDHTRPGKLATKYAKGVFLGREDRSGQVLVGTPAGLVRSPKFLRLPEEEQFSAGALDAIAGLPWDTTDAAARDEEEGEEEEAPAAPSPPLPSGDAAADPSLPLGARRGPYLTRARARRFGLSEKCPGCDAIRGGRPYAPHTALCADRLTRAMIADL